MALHRYSVLGGERPDSGVPLDLVSNQITAAAAPSIGNMLVYIVVDGGADEGLYFSFDIPENYVNTPKIIVKGILDGAPGAADTLGFGFRKRASADNEPADGTFDAEQVASATIGSNGLGYSDEDEVFMSITLTAGDYAVGDQVKGYVYLDATGTTYVGNFLWEDVIFQYGDGL
jgi:hypothetical protein